MNNGRDYIEEKFLDNQSKSIPINSLKILIELTEKRICKIELKDGGYGTGFFCSIPFFDSWETYKTLITNNHVLTEENLRPGEIIKFSINNDKKQFKIKINDKRTVNSSKEDDISIIELKPEDGLSQDSFFEIDKRIFDNNLKTIFKNEPVFLLHYPKGKQMNFADGLIKNIFEDDFTFAHLCDSSEGSSGGPIINATTFQVIGVHKGGAIGKNYNLGSLIKISIEKFNKIIKNKSIDLINNNNNEIIKGNEDINLDNISQSNIKENKKEDENIINNKKVSLLKEEEKEENNNKINKNIIQDKNNKLCYDNGEYYIGEIKNGIRQGKGILYDQNGNIKYEGEFVNDKFEGNGKYIWENGEYYIGQLVFDLKCGKGKLYDKNNRIKYDGEFANDFFEGKGKYNLENDEYYIGQGSKGYKNGQGILYYKNGTIKYIVDFVNNKIEGKGKFIYENGEYYIGQFLNNLKNGKGFLYYKNGNVKYEGDFKNDKIEGNGKYFYENGEYYDGYWINEVRQGKENFIIKMGILNMKEIF